MFLLNIVVEKITLQHPEYYSYFTFLVLMATWLLVTFGSCCS